MISNIKQKPFMAGTKLSQSRKVRKKLILIIFSVSIVRSYFLTQNMQVCGIIKSEAGKRC